MISGIIIFVLLVLMIIFLSDEFENKIAGVIFFLLFAGGLSCLVVLSCHVPLQTITQTNKVDIVALSNSALLHGEYFLFGGYVNQNPVYYYYQKTSDGGFVEKNISANNVVIYQDTASEGYILIIETKSVADKNFAKKYNKWVPIQSYYSDNFKIEIHVPPNTIIQQFNLDLSKQ
jgi:hypothetical protein